MLDLEKIFAANAATRAAIAAKEARIKAEALKARKLWETECEKLRAGLLTQAAAKATAWLRKELITPEELIRVEEFANGCILHIKMEDANGEEREWEIQFLFFFKGNSPDTLTVKWETVSEDRKMMESYYECD